MNIRQLKLLIKDLPDDAPVLLSDSCSSFCDADILIKDVECYKNSLYYELDEDDWTEDSQIIKALTIY